MKKTFLIVLLIIGVCFGNENLDLNSSLSQDLLISKSSLEDKKIKLGSDLNNSSDINFTKNLEYNDYSTKDIEKKDFSLFSLYNNADFVVKSVIYILLFFSIITWMIFIAKALQLNRYSKILNKDIKNLNNVKFLSDSLVFEKNSFADIFAKEILDEIKKSKNSSNVESRIQTRLEIEISNIYTNSKNFVSVLASVGSSAPFIGLFGTVWGIMNSFIGIATSNNAGLDVVAPGIAEALFATAFGLVAAIPAVLFYNYILRKSAKFLNSLSEVSTLLFIITDRTLHGEKL